MFNFLEKIQEPKPVVDLTHRRTSTRKSKSMIQADIEHMIKNKNEANVKVSEVEII